MAMFLEGTQGHRKIFGQVALEALEQVFSFCFSLKTYAFLVFFHMILSGVTQKSFSTEGGCEFRLSMCQLPELRGTSGASSRSTIV